MDSVATPSLIVSCLVTMCERTLLASSALSVFAVAKRVLEAGLVQVLSGEA